MTYRTRTRREQLANDHPTAWEAGYDWAYGLKIGDTWRGTQGEGRARGLEGDALAAFEVGADSALQGWATVKTMGANPCRIVKLEAR